MVFKEHMIKYLELDQQGFEIIRPESSYTVFGDEDDTPFIGYCDPIDLANHLVEEHGFEAMQGFQGLAKYFVKWKEMFDRYADDPNPPTMEQLVAKAPDEETRETLATLCYSSAVEVMRKFFPQQGKYNTILGSLSTSAIDGTHMGPFTKGSALSLAYHFCAGDNYDFKIPKGGIGSLSDALEKVFNKYAVPLGGEIRYRSPIENVIIEEEDGKNAVKGVRLETGEEIRSKTVISTPDPKCTYLRFCDTTKLPADFIRAVEDIEYTNGYIQIHLAIKELPTFTKQLAFVNGTPQSWLVGYIQSPELLHAAWKQYKKGEVPDDPAVYCYFPSQLDPSLAPEGHHTCTMFAHYFPANPPKGELKAMKNLMSQRMLDRIESIAPGFKDSIMKKAVFTKHYFEQTFNATGGDFTQGLLHPGQVFGDRPVAGWAAKNTSAYKTPLENLYMAGGGCHPGPGVTCLPGMYGARAVLEQLNTMDVHATAVDNSRIKEPV
jgi:phytoene dehydrogenase-like protein